MQGPDTNPRSGPGGVAALAGLSAAVACIALAVAAALTWSDARRPPTMGEEVSLWWMSERKLTEHFHLGLTRHAAIFDPRTLPELAGLRKTDVPMALAHNGIHVGTSALDVNRLRTALSDARERMAPEDPAIRLVVLLPGDMALAEALHIIHRIQPEGRDPLPVLLVGRAEPEP